MVPLKDCLFLIRMQQCLGTCPGLSIIGTYAQCNFRQTSSWLTAVGTICILFMNSLVNYHFSSISIQRSSYMMYRCYDPNLFMRPVQIETRDTHYYHVCILHMKIFSKCLDFIDFLKFMFFIMVEMILL